jgi:soluble lytic murein transglycosylase
VDPALVRAIIRAESSFDASAVSRKGAMGLMQLMPRTARSLNLTNPYDPQQNIAGGVKYLRHLLDRFDGNVPLALAAYNAGESRVFRESRIPRISETREYVRRVLRYYKAYRQQDLLKLTAIDIPTRPAPRQYASSN